MFLSSPSAGVAESGVPEAIVPSTYESYVTSARYDIISYSAQHEAGVRHRQKDSLASASGRQMLSNEASPNDNRVQPIPSPGHGTEGAPVEI